MILLPDIIDPSHQLFAASHSDVLTVIEGLIGFRIGERTDSATESATGFDQPSFTTVFRKVHCGLNPG